MRTKKKTNFLKTGSAVLAGILIVAMLIGLLPNGQVALAAEKISDLDTTTKYTESLGDNASTEYAGRIWTDKTVYSGEDVTMQAYGGAEYTIENDSDFLISFSALATGQSVSGQTQAPIDVVFVIDLSGSMSNGDSGMDNGYSRIYNTIQAVNDSIQKLMDMNEYTRVGVVGFSRGAVTLLPLDRYTKSGNNAYFSLSEDEPSDNNATLYTRAVGSSGNTITSDTQVVGGTNIQAGVYEGMNLLASASSTTVTIDGKEVKRVPSVIILSDGAPTFSSESTNWWAPSTAEGDRQGDGSSPYYGNGMLAMMTAAYMKDAIDRHYEVSGAYSTSIYTVGMGIEDLTNNQRNLARVVLNPALYWDADNTYATNIRDAWDHYVNGETTTNWWGQTTTTYTPDITVDRNESYTVEHPTTNDINEEDALKTYVDAYYDANDAASVMDVFSDIVNSIAISTPEVPTEHDTENPLDSGYITYTDPIGEYMEVKDMKAIIYAGQQYTAHSVTTTDNVTTYAFTETATGNDVYGPDQPLNKILIEVTTETDAEGIKTQVLTIKIPAALIPIRVNTVTLKSDDTVESHTNNGAYPIRVLYTVGLQDAVKSGEMVALEKLSQEYLEKNSNADGTVDFYSNLYTGTNTVNGMTAGDATAEFTAASTNPFYYMQKDVLLYEDEALTQPASADTALQADKTYYYKETFYHGTNVETNIVKRTGAQLSGNTVIIEKDGYWYRPAGTPRVNRMLEFEGTKSQNSTETAQDFYAPTYDSATGQFVVYLGNNGLMSVLASGTLKISKTVEAAYGLTAPDEEFTFTVSLKDASDNALSGTYNYTVTDAAGNEVRTGSIADGGTVSLKAGQSATITNLPPEAKYTVTESAVDGFTTFVGGSNTDTASGTITAGEVSNADFVNNYSVEELTITSFPVGAKILDGRDWTDTDAYTFVLTADNPDTTPMTEKTSVTVTKDNLVDGKAVFDFGGVTLTQPGTYVYSMVEQVRELSGVTYSAAQYSVVIIVTDNGNGTLRAETELYKMVDHDGTHLFNDENPYGVPVEDEVALFVNTYDATSTSYGQVVHKIYYDNTEGSNPLTDGMFTFKLEAGDDNTPMPHGTLGGVLYAGNVGDTAIFDQITYTQDMAGNTYTYYITEVIPEGATDNGDGTWTYNGMTYDGTKHTTTVRVYLDNSDVNEAKVALEVKYDGVSAESDAWYVEFTNAYTPAPTTVNLDGNKTLVGRDMKTDEAFEFVLAPGNAATNLAIRTGAIVMGDTTATVTGGNDGQAVSFEFDNVTFTKPGTYVFNITETAGEAGGVTYDDHVCAVTVVVTDNNGQLVAEVTYNNGADAADNTQAVFNNTYTATFDVDTAIDLAGTKELTGRPLAAGEFFFEVVLESNGARATLIPSTGDTDGVADENGVYEGTMQFLEDVTYTEAGTYVYYIREAIPEPARGGTTYDTSVYKATVVVTDDLNGTLTAELTKLEKSTDNGATYTEAGAEGIVFRNTYETTPVTLTPYEMTKVLTGKRNEGLKAGEFTFKKTVVSADPADGVILPNPSVITNDANGKVQFSDITFTKPGTYVIQIEEVIPEDAVENADGTYTKDGVTYDTHVVQSTFRVTDDYAGNLTVVRTATTGSRVFNNVYESTGTLEGATNLKVTKQFLGRENDAWLESDEFTFVLEAMDDATKTAIMEGKIVLPENATGIIIDDTDAVKEKAFGDIVFYEAGTYTFIVREEVGENPIPGVDYDATSRTITVTATDNGDGTLTVTAAGTENLTFTNIYNPDDVLLYGHGNLNVTKVFTGRENDEWLDTDSFTFTLAVDDTHAATVAAVEAGQIEMEATSLTVTKDNKEHAHFGDIVFKEAGTYQFVVIEEKGDLPGVTYSTEKKIIIVNVVDETDGTMSVSVADNSDALTFTNTYAFEPVDLIGQDNLKVTKAITGRDWFNDDAFTFTLEPADQVTKDAVYGTEATEETEAVLPTITLPDNAAGITISGADSVKEAAFGNITFTEPGTYSFLIKETAGEDANISYDGHSATVSVTVEDNNNGKLVVTNVKTSGSMTWTNEYTPDAISVSLEGVKEITGRNMTDSDIFQFVILAEGTQTGIPMPQETRVENSGADITFGPISYTEVGTYKYTIYEERVDANGITSDAHYVIATVTVTYDSATGTFDAVTSYERLTPSGTVVSEEFKFVNVYDATGVLEGKTNLKVTKNFTGRVNDAWLETDSFTFTLAADSTHAATVDAVTKGNIVMPETTLVVTNNNKDDAYFGDITFKTAGTYQFVVTEAKGDIAGVTYDGAAKKVIVNVVDDGDGVMEVTLTEESQALEFTNTYKTTETTLDGAENLKVTKALSGRNWFAGDEFTFTLTTGDEKTAEAVTAGDVVLPADANGITISGTDSLKEKAFGDITFKKIGEYTFVITETAGDVDNVVYDGHSAVIVVTVIDNKLGQLVVSSTEVSESMTWENTYTPDALEVSLTGEKVIVGRPMTEADVFNFTIEVAEGSADNTPLPTVTSVNNNNSVITFGPIAYTAEGTYKYVIREDALNEAGVISDTGYVIATVTVDYDETDGKFKETVSYQKMTVSEEAAEGGFKFVNTYGATGTLEGKTNLKVTKNFTGRVNDAWLDTDSFTFTLAVDAEHKDTADAFAAGKIVMPTQNELVVTEENKDEAYFGDIIFTQAGTYQFVVTEVKGDIPGVTYDTTPRVVKVTVVDNLDGTMTASIADGSAALSFNNVYDTQETALNGAANLKVTKNFVGRVNDAWLDTDSFTFTLEIDAEHKDTVDAAAAGNIVLPADANGITISGTDEAKEKAFGDIIFKETGRYQFVVKEETGNIPGVTYSTVTKTVTVNVVDNTDGTMTASIVEESSDALVFENTYTPGAVTATLEGTKVMSGRDLKATDIFEFTITAIDGAPLPAEVTVENEADGTITFAPITYTSVGTYVYEIRETGGSAAGVTNAANVVTATVKVTDNPATARLEQSVAYSAGGFVFENVYNTTSTDPVAISATKTVTPSEGNSYVMQGGEFEFTITPSADNPTSDPVQGGTVSNNADGSVVFAQDVRYTEAGTYTYTVQEVSGNIGGMSYVGDIYVVTVEVTDDESTAKLSAVVAIKKNGETVNAITFDNGYDPAETTATIAGTKELTVNGNKDKQLEADEFTFKLTAVDGAPMPENDTVKNTEAGVFQFGSITYTAPGTYKYTVNEINDSKKGYSYDPTVYEVTITVVDENGALKVEENTSVTSDIVFENTYTPDSVTLERSTALKGTKKLTGRTMEKGEFLFQLLDKDNKVVDESANGEDGSFTLEPITFTETGTYYYTIVEKNTALGGVTYDENTYTVKVVVTDEGGYLAANVTYLQADVESSVVFNNTYKAAPTSIQLSANKKLTGRNMAAEEFEFVLEDEAGNKIYAKNDETGLVLFEKIEYTEAGTYLYKLSEVKGTVGGVTYDETVYDVTVTVVDELDGHLSASVSYQKDGSNVETLEFNNAYKAAPVSVQISAFKKLTGRDLVEGEFEFVLEDEAGNKIYAKNGKDGVILFEAIEYTEAGTYVYKLSEVKGTLEDVKYDANVYTVTVTVEDQFDGFFKATVSGESEEFTFNNTYVEKVPEVQTGDTTPTTMFAIMMMAAVGTMVAALYEKRRKIK